MKRFELPHSVLYSGFCVESAGSCVTDHATGQRVYAIDGNHVTDVATDCRLLETDGQCLKDDHAGQRLLKLPGE